MKSLKKYLGAIICVLFTVQAYSQSTTSSNTFIPGDFIGYNGTSNDLFFRTNNFNRGVLKDVTGFWGIGTNFLNPNQLLTVNAGNINVQNITTGVHNNGYMIGNTITLWRGTAGSVTNIFVGGNAGFFNGTGINNTFVGNISGAANTAGSRNTFVGFASGLVNDGASDNTFLGYQSGRNNTGPTNIQNTYVGSEAGFTNTGSTNNTYVGYRSGYLGTGLPCKENTLVGGRAGYSNQGTGQTFIGFEAGFNQSSAAVSGNTFIGHTSGWSNLSGGENTFVGFRSGYTNTASTNTFIGFRSGEFNQSGTGNAFLGDFSGNQNTTGNANVYLGSNAGRSNTIGSNNTFSGNSAGRSNTVGIENTFNGTNSGFSNTVGKRNTFLGFDAGFFNNADNNTFVGDSTGYNNLSGGFNTFVGSLAGFNNTIARGNVFTGRRAGFFNVNGDYNTFTGTLCGYFNVNGAVNSFYGKESGFHNISGNENCFYGNHSGFTNTSGNDNVYFGFEAALNASLGNNNVVIGRDAAFNMGALATENYNIVIGSQAAQLATGNDNIIIGGNADALNGYRINAIAIGSNSYVNANDKMILGNNNINVGIGLSNDGSQNGPQNKLEIDAGLFLTAQQPSGLAGASGLRFRDLHLGNTPSLQNGVVLSVDINGDVILVPAGGAALGTCATPSTFSGANGAIDLANTDNFYFIGNGAGPSFNNVIIGKNCSAPVAKLDVLQASNVTNGSIGIYSENQDLSGTSLGQEVIGIKSFIPFQSNSTSVGQIGVQGIVSGDKFNIAIDGLANSTGVNVFNLGGRFLATSTTAVTNTGATATAQDGSTNEGINAFAFNGSFATGVTSQASGATTSNTGLSSSASGGITNTGIFSNISSSGTINFGTRSRADGASTNFGGRFDAPGTSGANYAIYASSPSIPGSNYAGYFNGDVVRTGTDNFTSDRNLKQNIDSISNAIQIINLLNPKTFYFDTTAHSNMGLSSKKQWGFVAQEVEPVLPELVGSATQPAEFDSLGNITSPSLTYKTLNYNAFIAILMKGIQEQESKIDSLSNAMAAMQYQINGCCSSNARTQNTNLNQTDVTLTNSESVVLNQNVPNPFAEQTTITYNLPESVQKAQLLFYDATGKLIKAVDLTARGQGQINVFANDLSNGIYSYALVVDGQIADTKRMVKTN